MRILMTGVTGFLGSHLARRWVSAGHQVIGIRRATSRMDRLGEIGAAIEWFTVNEEGAAPSIAFTGVEAIVHLAANYGRRGETNAAIARSNTLFPVGLLDLAIRAKVPVFVHADTALPAEANAYALAKSHFAAWGRQCAEGGSIQFLNLRLEHFYGPGDDEMKFTARVINACRNHEPELRLSTGEQERDFVHVSDVVEAFDIVLQERVRIHRGYMDIPVGSGETISIRQLVTLIHELTGSRTQLRFGAVEADSRDLKYSRADNTFLRALGWRPRIALREGLEQTICSPAFL